MAPMAAVAVACTGRPTSQESKKQNGVPSWGEGGPFKGLRFHLGGLNGVPLFWEMPKAVSVLKAHGTKPTPKAQGRSVKRET